MSGPSGIATMTWSEQLRAVYEVMKSGRWFTLGEVTFHASAPEASVSALIRDLDNKKGVPHERHQSGHGLVEQQLIASPSTP